MTFLLAMYKNSHYSTFKKSKYLFPMWEYNRVALCDLYFAYTSKVTCFCIQFMNFNRFIDSRNPHLNKDTQQCHHSPKFFHAPSTWPNSPLTSTPNSQICSLSLKFFLLKKLHINGIVQCVYFCDLPLTQYNVFEIYPYCLAINSLFLGVLYSFFSHWPIEGHWSCLS